MCRLIFAIMAMTFAINPREGRAPGGVRVVVGREDCCGECHRVIRVVKRLRVVDSSDTEVWRFSNLGLRREIHHHIGFRYRYLHSI